MDKIYIKHEENTNIISSELHGHFIEFLGGCLQDGIWVGEDSAIPNYNGFRKDAVDALKKLGVPVLRWPGGCYADKYHWRDGIGTRKDRPVTYNENFNTFELENNQFGTHEFMELCEMIGAEPWLNVNMLTGTVAEAAEWFEYCNREEETSLTKERTANGSKKPFDVKYWGIGNESWAGGGMYTPQSYMVDYRKFATGMPTFNKVGPNGLEGSDMKFIAVGPDGNKREERVQWTKQFFDTFGEFRQPKLDAIDLHFYNWNIKNPEDKVLSFDENGWYSVISGSMEIEEVIKEQYKLVKEGLKKIKRPVDDYFYQEPHCDLYIGEWGNWHREAFFTKPALYQQCTIRDALTTAITLDIFHKNCDVLKLACVAQTINVLNSIILTEGETIILTPNYYVFEMYKVHRDAVRMSCETDTSAVYEKDGITVNGTYSFASEKDGIISVNIINTDMENSRDIELSFEDAVIYKEGTLLNSDFVMDYNSKEHPVSVISKKANKPSGAGNTWKITVPSASISVYRFTK